jgi:bifunctional DNA-binding transcriptional regulator/antitoxin component of YhaV-PrlF toxin-antitoxin module
MDPAGRVVIPHEIRREASLEPGTPLEVWWCDGVIENRATTVADHART